MKMIFLGEAASDSGSFGFSEAWPLDVALASVPGRLGGIEYAPSCPNSVDVHPLGNVDDQLDVGVVVVVCASGHLRLSAVALLGGHRTLHWRALTSTYWSAMRMYSAFACRSSGVAMTVNWMARSSPKVSYAHFRTERISLTAAMPLLAMSTLVMTVWPSWAATKSLTLPGDAAPRWFPPMKCGARLYLAAEELGLPLAEPLVPLC
jgi:hypothetical protein